MPFQIHPWPNKYLNKLVETKRPENIAADLGVERSAVYYWLRTGWVPDARIADVVRAYKLDKSAYVALCRPAMRHVWRSFARRMS
jgi:hypothetical protein